MALARTIARVGEDSALREHAFVSDAGEPCAWLDAGADRELGVYGSPAAMRRFAAAVLAVADAADELLQGREARAVVAP